MAKEKMVTDSLIKEQIRDSINRIICHLPKEISGVEKLTTYSKCLIDKYQLHLRKIDLSPNSEVDNNNSTQQLIISNHPGSIDIPLIISMLDQYSPEKIGRLRIMVSPGTINFYRNNISPEIFISVGASPKENTTAFNTAAEWVNSGNNLLMFPKGSDIIKPNHSGIFEAGIAFLIERIEPTATIQALKINPNYYTQLLQQFTDQRAIWVDILSYSSAITEWQGHVQTNRQQYRETLTKHYERLLEMKQPDCFTDNTFSAVAFN